MTKSLSKYLSDFFAIILLVILVLMYSAYSQTPENNSIKNAEEAINRALLYTGFDKVNKINVKDMSNYVKLTKITNTKIPFLEKSVEGKDIWEIEFQNINISHIYEKRTGLEKSITMSFSVYIDKETGKLLEIHYIKDGYNSEDSPLPSTDLAEQQMNSTAEIYYRFPDSLPEYPFIDALDNTAINPAHAREIIGYYIIESKMDSTPRRVWAIDLRGIVPVPVASENAEKYVPIYQRNHRRTIIDAKTRHQLFTNTLPQAPRKQSDTDKTEKNKNNK